MNNSTTRIVIDDRRFFLIGLICFLFGAFFFILAPSSQPLEYLLEWGIYSFVYYLAILFIKVLVNNISNILSLGEPVGWSYVPVSKYSLSKFFLKYFGLAIYLSLIIFVLYFYYILIDLIYYLLYPMPLDLYYIVRSESIPIFIFYLLGSLGYIFLYLKSPQNLFINPRKERV